MHPNDGRVVSNFIVQALKDEPITIYGDGRQTGSFCCVDDLIEGFVNLMDSSAEITGPINLGNPGEFTMLELAEMTIELTGSNSKLVFLQLTADDFWRPRGGGALGENYRGCGGEVSGRASSGDVGRGGGCLNFPGP